MENDSITTSPTDVATAAMLHAVATDKAPAYTISAQSRAASVTPLATAAATAAANVLTLQHSESGLKTYAVVRKHGVNGGFDTKFDTHTYPAGLHGQATHFSCARYVPAIPPRLPAPTTYLSSLPRSISQKCVGVCASERACIGASRYSTSP